MSDLKKLQALAGKFSILYVEDNVTLRMKAAKFLKKFFLDVTLAEDGKEGLAFFQKNHYPIVITDIKMPKMDGLDLISHIKKINPQTETIVMSAFDEKDMLLKEIELGVFRFIKKPVNATELADVLFSALEKINHEQHTKLFYMHLKSVFNYQSSMVCMLQDAKILLANEMFLEFFNCNTVDECPKDIGRNFLEHDGFLYNSDGIHAIESLQHNPNKLFHVKLKDSDGAIKHFIAKYHTIPDKVGFGVLSFDDVTELNLLKLFDANQSSQDEVVQDSEKLFQLLKVIQRNSAKVELHNYYKGLSVTHPGVIVEIKEDAIVLKTSYMQQKAVQIEQKLLIESSAFPFTVEANDIRSISFDKQTIEVGDVRFVKTSPIMRKTIRVAVEGTPSISLFLGENKFHGDITLEDISLEAVRLKLNALPAGLEKDSVVRLDIVLELDKRPLIINTEGVLLKKSESKHSFTLVILFKDLKKSALVKYITKRQMALIRELKGMQNG